MSRTFVIALGLFVAGCARGGANDDPPALAIDGAVRDGGVGDSGVLSDAGGFDSAVSPLLDSAVGLDATNGVDGGDLVIDGGMPGIDATTRDAGRSGSTDLDPALSIPPVGNPSCATPNTGCRAGETWCRLYSSTEGRYEGCTTCDNQNDPCSTGEDCNLFFVCYTGRCTLMCELGSSTCGDVNACLDIGHPTRGVCRPRT